jgi:hypothetical protein
MCDLRPGLQTELDREDDKPLVRHWSFGFPFCVPNVFVPSSVVGLLSRGIFGVQIQDFVKDWNFGSLLFGSECITYVSPPPPPAVGLNCCSTECKVVAGVQIE